MCNTRTQKQKKNHPLIAKKAKIQKDKTGLDSRREELFKNVLEGATTGSTNQQKLQNFFLSKFRKKQQKKTTNFFGEFMGREAKRVEGRSGLLELAGENQQKNLKSKRIN